SSAEAAVTGTTKNAAKAADRNARLQSGINFIETSFFQALRELTPWGELAIGTSQDANSSGGRMTKVRRGRRMSQTFRHNRADPQQPDLRVSQTASPKPPLRARARRASATLPLLLRSGLSQQ